MASWTNKRRQFVEEYFRCGMNATEAARRAGYAHPGSQGHRLLKNVDIAEEIERRLADLAMDADEVVRRLSEQSRATIEDFLSIDDKGEWRVDLAKAQQEGRLHLVKEVWVDKEGCTRLRLHDAQAALVQMGRAHGVFRDRLEHSVKLEDVLAALPADFREAVRRELAAVVS